MKYESVMENALDSIAIDAISDGIKARSSALNTTTPLMSFILIVCLQKFMGVSFPIVIDMP